MQFVIGIAGAGLLLLAGAGRPQTTGTIDVREIKYDDLKEAVLKQRGKVVVVDFWSTTCPPCRKAFPHMVEMQHRYADIGLATISVSLDPLESKTSQKRKEEVLRDLQRFQADITNFILDERDELIQKKLRIDSLPCVYVFSRQGRWTQFGGNPKEGVDPAAVEKLVTQLLQEK